MPPLRAVHLLIASLLSGACSGTDEGRVSDHVTFYGVGKVARFEQHNARVKERVPPERLLVMEIKDGWEPLCDFLGKPIPDGPFPHLNEGLDTIRKGHWELAFGRRGAEDPPRTTVRP